MTAEAALDADVRGFDDLKENVRTAEERCLTLRSTFERGRPNRDARRALEYVRAEAAQLDVPRATAEADLSHLAQRARNAWRRRWTKWRRKSSSSRTAWRVRVRSTIAEEPPRSKSEADAPDGGASPPEPASRARP